MSNDTEEFIEVENEAVGSGKEFEGDDVNAVGEKPILSEGYLDTPSDATTTEATSGSSIEDVPSSKQSDFSHPCGYMEFLRSLDPPVIDILYWRNPQTTGAIFGFGLLFLFAVSLNPFIHTVVLLLLASMVVSLLYCVGMVLWNSFYNRPVENPFRAKLQKDSVVSKENIIEIATVMAERIDYWSLLLFQLILFHNVKASLKFGLVLWIMSYITPCLTIVAALFIGFVLTFAVPKVYELYEVEIDKYIEVAFDKIKYIEKRCPGPSSLPSSVSQSTIDSMNRELSGVS